MQGVTVFLLLPGMSEEHAQPDHGLSAGPVREPQDHQPRADLARGRQLHSCPPAVRHVEEGGGGDWGQEGSPGCHHR